MATISCAESNAIFVIYNWQTPLVSTLASKKEKQCKKQTVDVSYTVSFGTITSKI